MINKKIIFIVLIMFMLTGCSMNEIEEYAIVSGIGIDYNDNKFIVTYEIYKENNGQTTSLTSITKSGEGKTLSSAVSSINNKMYQTPYLNHCLLIILDENVINSKLDEVFNYLMHDVRIRSSCFIVSTQSTTSKELLEQSQNINQVISYNIYKKLDQSPSQVSIWNNSHFDFIMNEKIDKNGVAIIPIVSYKEDLSITNVYIIDNENKVFYGSKQDIFIFQLFNNSVDEGLIKLDDKYIHLKSLKSNMNINNETLNLKVYLQLLSYDDLNIDLNNKEEKKQLIDKLEISLENMTQETFKKYQENKVDAFYIYKNIERYNQLLYQEIEQNYIEFYQTIKLNLSIKIDLLTSGLSEERIE